MGEAEGKKVTILNLRKGAIKVMAEVGNTLRLPINSERLGKLTENYVVSNDKIKQALGEELPLSTREGIKKTIQSFQNKP